MAPITIIGSGLAGYTLARELRKLAPDLPLRIICNDSGDFYSKPMLSNALHASKSPSQLAMKSAAQMSMELNAEVLDHRRVDAVLPMQHQLQVNGETLAYSKLVLAIGADQIDPGLQGDAAATVLTVNDLQSYARFRDRLYDKQRIALLGAGLIGCEFANDLASQGYQVTVIDPAGWPLSRLLPAAGGALLQHRLEAVGVNFRFGVTARSVERGEHGQRIVLSDGSCLDADLTLSAIGLRPRLALAIAAGLTVNRGVVVNRLLQSSDSDIYALGDCAEVEGQVLPFVMPIMHAARALATTLAGTPTAVRYPAMPVVVKTPACPTVVSPPASGAVGQWWIEQLTDGLKALFQAEDGKLLGFALLGSASTQRQALTPQLPTILA